LPISSPEFVANVNYDGGVTNDSLLAGGGANALQVGEEGFVLLNVTLDNCGTGDFCYCNSALVIATDPIETMIFDDLSQSGSDPDPDGDLDPTNNDECTLVKFGFNPSFGVAKRVSEGPIADGTGCFDLTYEIRVENTGDQNIGDIQIIDSLVSTFAGADSFSVISVESEEFMVNPNYDGGVTDALLLLGNDTLDVATNGNEGVVYLKVKVCPGADLGPYENTAVGNGFALDGTVLIDSSQNGSDPNPDGDSTSTNNNDVTPISFMVNPSFGVAKRAVSVTLMDDGSTNVVYEFNVENFGDVNLDSLQITDDLAMAFPAPCNVSVTGITSDDFLVNDAFDGIADMNLLLGSDDLPIGDKGAILLTLNISDCGSNMGPFENTAVGSANSPNDSTLVDSSASGSDPDPNGDGNPDETDPTVIMFGQNPSFGTAKRAASVTLMDDGSTQVVYEINVENFGDVNLDSLQIMDDLASAFPTPCVPTVVEITSDDFTVNDAFDGVADMNLLTGSDDLPVGDQGAILLTLNVSDCGSNMGPFGNIVTATANSPGDSTLMDTSASGSDPDPNGDGNPDEADTTFIMFGQVPSFGVAKRAVSVKLNDDGCTTVSYEINVENFGDVDLDSLQVMDDLAMAFPAPCALDWISVTSDDFTVNPDFDGTNDMSLLIGSDDLPVGDKGAILLQFTVCDCGSNMGPFENIAVGSVNSPGDSMLIDSSADGSDPDPNGDGNPDETTPTVIMFGQNPSFGTAKRAVSVMLMDDGSTQVVYEINVENFGDVDLDSLQIMDDLVSAFPSPCVPTVTAITSDDFIVNDAFDGVADMNLLSGNDDLPVGDKGAILLTLNVADCGSNMGPFGNIVTATAMSPGDSILMDTSANGSDPDPNGDNNPDEADTTFIMFGQNPAFGTAKRAVSVSLMDDGSTQVVYEINVENFGDVDLDSLQIMDDLASVFPTPCVPTVTTITSDDFIVNDAFDGVADVNLLLGSDDLPVGDKGAILITLNVSDCGSNMGPFGNIVTATANSPGDSTLMDTSASGSDPDPNGDGNPDEADTTFIMFGQNPSFGTAKRAASVTLMDDGSTQVVYEINVENFGDVNLDSLQIM
ncbi:MAG: hypothetical protein AAGK97_03175, partial [Bacteroidota bacterium]